MQKYELNNVYLYAFKEGKNDSTESHVCISNGQEIIDLLNEGNDTVGTIKAFIQNEGMKVFKVFREEPLVSISESLSKWFSISPSGSINNTNEITEDYPFIISNSIA